MVPSASTDNLQKQLLWYFRLPRMLLVTKKTLFHLVVISNCDLKVTLSRRNSQDVRKRVSIKREIRKRVSFSLFNEWKNFSRDRKTRATIAAKEGEKRRRRFRQGMTRYISGAENNQEEIGLRGLLNKEATVQSRRDKCSVLRGWARSTSIMERNGVEERDENEKELFQREKQMTVLSKRPSGS